GKDAVPRRADRAVLPGDQPGVARPPPVVHVARDGKVGIRVQPPVIRVLQHVAQEPNVLRPSLADHALSLSSAGGDVFCELDAVAVRIEHVQEAHLAVQLEDDADLDALVAELICRGLDVRDVDVRDAAVLLRLPLGEPDLHRAALELRPPVVGIEERLREAELVPVERAAPVEVPHVVPDGHYRARPGSSRSCFTVARNSAPVAPSTARWSHVSVSSMRGRTAGCPSTATTLSSTAPTARIAACGGLSTAMNRSMPYIPRFEIVNVPPSRSP